MERGGGSVAERFVKLFLENGAALEELEAVAVAKDASAFMFRSRAGDRLRSMPIFARCSTTQQSRPVALRRPGWPTVGKAAQIRERFQAIDSTSSG